jgi:hypothetical protein
MAVILAWLRKKLPKKLQEQKIWQNFTTFFWNDTMAQK